MTLYRIVNDIGHSILVEVLNKLQVKFNAKKCKVMHMGTKNAKTDYILDGIILNKVKGSMYSCFWGTQVPLTCVHDCIEGQSDKGRLPH